MTWDPLNKCFSDILFLFSKLTNFSDDLKKFCKTHITVFFLNKVLARPYLMTIHVIFSIHVNFPIKSRFVLKAIINRKKQWTVLCYLRNFFFQEYAFYDIVQLCCIWLIFPFYYNLFIFFMFLYESFHVKWTKLGHFPGKRYIDRIILKISEQTDNLFKSYDTSKLAF